MFKEMASLRAKLKVVVQKTYASQLVTNVLNFLVYLPPYKEAYLCAPIFVQAVIYS